LRIIRADKLLPEEKLLSFYRKTELNTVDAGSDRTVVQVIKQFEDLLCLKVLLLRRSGNVWIETTQKKDIKRLFLSEIGDRANKGFRDYADCALYVF
jgi:hypothetical protein